MANVGVKGIDHLQTATALIFRSLFRTSTGALLGSGSAYAQLQELQSDGTIKSYDFNDNTFKTTALTTGTLALTARPANNSTFTTGLFTGALSTLTGLTIGGLYVAICSNPSATPTDDARMFTWGSAPGDEIVDLAGTNGRLEVVTIIDLATSHADATAYNIATNSTIATVTNAVTINSNSTIATVTNPVTLAANQTIATVTNAVTINSNSTIATVTNPVTLAANQTIATVTNAVTIAANSTIATVTNPVTINSNSTIATVTNPVTIQAGTGTGQLDFTAGVVKANWVQILGTAITGTAAWLAAAITKFFNVASPNLTTGGTDQSGDSYARIGVNGAGLTGITGVTLAANQVVVLTSAYDAAKTAASQTSVNGLAAATRDAIANAIASDYTTPGSIGYIINTIPSIPTYNATTDIATILANWVAFNKGITYSGTNASFTTPMLINGPGGGNSTLAASQPYYAPAKASDHIGLNWGDIINKTATNVLSGTTIAAGGSGLSGPVSQTLIWHQHNSTVSIPSVPFLIAGVSVGQDSTGTGTLTIGLPAAGNFTITSTATGCYTFPDTTINTAVNPTVIEANAGTIITPSTLSGTINAGVSVVRDGAVVPTAIVSFQQIAQQSLTNTGIFYDCVGTVQTTSSPGTLTLVAGGGYYLYNSLNANKVRVDIPLTAANPYPLPFTLQG